VPRGVSRVLVTKKNHSFPNEMKESGGETPRRVRKMEEAIEGET
jgi:hypothetical protein